MSRRILRRGWVTEFDDGGFAVEDGFRALDFYFQFFIAERFAVQVVSQFNPLFVFVKGGFGFEVVF